MTTQENPVFTIAEFCALNKYKPSQHEQNAWFGAIKKIGTRSEQIKIKTWGEKIKAVCLVKYNTPLGCNSLSAEIYTGANVIQCVKAIITYESRPTR